MVPPRSTGDEEIGNVSEAVTRESNLALELPRVGGQDALLIQSCFISLFYTLMRGFDGREESATIWYPTP